MENTEETKKSISSRILPAIFISILLPTFLALIMLYLLPNQFALSATIVILFSAVLAGGISWFLNKYLSNITHTFE